MFSSILCPRPSCLGVGMPLMQCWLPRPPVWGLGAGAGMQVAVPPACLGVGDSRVLVSASVTTLDVTQPWGGGCLSPFTFVLLCGWAVYCLFAQGCCVGCGARLAQARVADPPPFRGSRVCGLWRRDVRPAFPRGKGQGEAACAPLSWGRHCKASRTV